jgi:DnaJ-class molecular chaperone
MPDMKTTPPDACPACGGRGYVGEPKVIYPEPQIGCGRVDPHIRYAVETCPACAGSGRQPY